ncbi:MAG: tRNA (adenosine(37)-N6)-threonylcarbamoyltransferase complex ATPase subunit type 1 TsaE [Flavobacteriaceae bacterium]
MALSTTVSDARVRRQIALADEAASDALAAELALYARPGDLILLSGDLGAGKTHFARATIRAIANDAALDVPSPTFTLRQDYETARFPVAHFDFYRLNSGEEADELDIDGALSAGMALVEWPERAELLLRDWPTTLSLHFDFGDSGGRTASLEGRGSWAERLARRDVVNAFLNETGHEADHRAFLQGDASPRRYERLRPAAGGSLILMDAPEAPDPGLAGGPSYSRIARLAESVRPFIAMARGLRDAGLHAPAILAANARAGLILLDDLGDGRIVDAGGPIPERYEAAVDALAHLHGRDMREAADGYRLPLYAMETMLAEVSLACEWYLPWRYGHPAITKTADELQAAFRLVLEPVLHPADNKSWTLRDYHSPNIIWIESAAGIDRVGIIDFQDALIGPAAYDVASLCMDARVDVPEALEARLLDRYLTARGPSFDREGFRRDYAAMAAQRNSKILGIFARLALRDGKTRYLTHQPRIARYLKRALAHPHLKPVKDWYEAHLPEALDEKKVLK